VTNSSTLPTINPVSDALTRSVRPRAQRQRADDQLCGVAERGVQEPADAAAQMLGQRLGCAPHVGGERQDREHRRTEDRDVTIWRQPLERDRHRYEAKQHEEAVIPEEGH
jgi:hypothetical protein